MYFDFSDPPPVPGGWGGGLTTQHSIFGLIKSNVTRLMPKVHLCCFLDFFNIQKHVFGTFWCKTLFPSKSPEANQFVFSRAFHRVPTCILTFRTPSPLFLGGGTTRHSIFGLIKSNITRAVPNVRLCCFLHWFRHSKTCFSHFSAAKPHFSANPRRRINLFFQELSVEYPHVFLPSGPPPSLFMGLKPSPWG